MMIVPVRQQDGNATEVQVLFAAARRRRRRIRLAGGAVSLLLAVTAASVAASFVHRTPAPAGGGRGPAAGGGTATSPLVAWVDSDYRLRIGDLATLRQRIVAEANADPSMPLVAADGNVYWVNMTPTYIRQLGYSSPYVQQYDLATGKVRTVAPGQWIFPSADGRQLYVSQADDVSLLELPAIGTGPARRLQLPAGWYLPGGFSIAVANGIIVQSSSAPSLGHPPVLAIWNPVAGRVTVIGRGINGGDWVDPVSAFTPPGADYSLLAWMPATCRFPFDCPIKITNTKTLSSITLHSPLGYGFMLGGAFSPDGRELAVFVNLSAGDGGGKAELAIASAGTGALRLVRQASLTVGEDVAWALWLPGGKQLFVMGNYLVTSATLSARPVTMTPGGAQDPGFSAQVLPPSG
jgi:hypothetical protein